RLIYPLPSLTKAKLGSPILTNFLSQFTKTLLIKHPPLLWWSLKLDGISCMAIYENYILKSLNTRGDGIIGGDITYLKDIIIGIPQKLINNKYLVVRGELIISKEVWEHKYLGSYSNARALVSVKVNSGFISI